MINCFQPLDIIHINLPISLIYYINRIKEKIEIVISIKAIKILDKIEHPFMIKPLT
jgi:hypothetical protein